MGLWLIIALIFLIDFYNVTRYYYIPDEADFEGIIEICKHSKSTNNTYPEQNKYICKIKTGTIMYNNKQLTPKGFRVTLKLNGEENYIPGDTLYVQGTLDKYDKAKNYGGFDARKYELQNKNIGKLDAKYKVIKRRHDLNYMIWVIREKSSSILDSIYDEETSGTIKCLLLGNKDSINESVKESFRNSSLSHVLAISGMHVAYVVMIIEKVIQSINISKKKKNTICMIVLILFIFLTGMSASCMRACATYIYVLMGKNLNRKASSLRALIISFIIICGWNSYTIFDVGLWLSYMATLGILFFYQFINSILKGFIKIKYIRECFSISVSAQIVIIPIIVSNFNTINCSFLIPNILISFIIGPIVIIGYSSIFFYMICRPIAIGTSKIETLLMRICMIITKFSSSLPYSKVYVRTPYVAEIILFYIILVYVVLYFSNNKYRVLRRILGLKTKIGKINEALFRIH